jgi:hypothetical protein
MKVKKEYFAFASGQRDASGQKLEPEQQTAAHVVQVSIPATGSLSGQHRGEVSGAIIVEQTAQEMALKVAGRCGHCKHFDHANCQNHLRAMDHPGATIEQRQQVNQMRAGLIETQNAALHDRHMGHDGEMDVEHALASLGYCRVLSEVMNEETVVHPLSFCPNEIRTPEMPMGYFQPKDQENARAGSAKYDEIMQRAAGRIA